MGWFRDKKSKKPGVKKPAILTIAVKGGTGKTMVTRELIMRLSENMKLAAMDADVDSPNLAESLGVRGWMDLDEERYFLPIRYTDNVSLFSTSLWHPETARGWTQDGDQNQVLLRDAALFTRWGAVDLFLVDMPAGSSDEFRVVMSVFKKVLGVVVVTQPNTLDDLNRVLDITSRFCLPILGVVENMVEVECCQCGASNILFDEHGSVERICAEQGVPYAGFIGWVRQLQTVPEQGHPPMPEKYRHVIDTLVEAIHAAR